MWTMKNYKKLAKEKEEARFFFWEWEKLGYDFTN
jgi:hypothetical protein